MILNRNTYNIKPECFDEAVQLIKAEAASLQKPIILQKAVFGPFDQVVMDMEFESVAEHQEFWSSWAASPAAEKFFQRWDQLVQPTGSTELWDIHEPEGTPSDRPIKYINRRTFVAKQGSYLPLIDMLSAVQKENRYGVLFRILSGNIAPLGVLIVDFEFPSIDEYFRTWGAFGEDETTPAFLEKWNQMVMPGGKNELWEAI